MRRTNILFLIFLLLVCVQTQAEQGENGFIINLELPVIETGSYHKPYVAVWLEDKNRKPISTISLWSRKGKGEKWLKDLRKWWRKTGSHQLGQLDGVSGATRKAGQYKIVWQSNDNKKDKVADGDYVLHIEAVREKAGREHIKIPVSLPFTSAQSIQKRGKTEIGKISLQSLESLEINKLTAE